MAITDMRGQLPINNEASYSDRPLDGIKGITIHYTDSPPTATVHDIAAYQTSEAARKQTGNDTPFPGLAYTYAVPLSGGAVKAWDLSKRVWHSAAKVRGAYRNATNVGIVWIGNDTPTREQVVGIAEAILDVERQLSAAGRDVQFDEKSIEGHRDAPYATDCPGPSWPTWKPDVIAALERLRDAANGGNDGGDDEDGGGWADPGFAAMYRRNRTRMGKPTTLPFSDSFGNVWQKSEKGSAIWMKEYNRNFFLPLEDSSPPFSI